MPEPTAPASQQFDLVIVAGRQEAQYWRDLWKYRELLYFLSLRDILVRYKQTVLGVAWAVLRPVITITAFTIIFGRVARMPSEGLAYPVLVISGMLPWQLFSSALTEASASLTTNANLVAKVYFPRLLVPASSVLVCLVDFLITAVLMAGVLLFYHVHPGWRLVFLPVATVETIAASLGIGLWLAALNVNYRDFRYVVPFFVSIGLYVSPVGFSSIVIPEQWRLLYELNPMVGIIDLTRWAISGGQTTLLPSSLLLSALVTLACLVSGLLFFRKTEQTFADTI